MSYFYKENLELQRAVDTYFAQLSAYNDANFDGALSIILLGSLSRGEATWLQTDAGPVMVSDIEFFTVYPEGFTAFRQFDEAMADAARNVFPEQTSSLFHIDNTYVCRARLPYMERKLLTYDARMMGKTVVGQDDLTRLPLITLENINRRDIRDILTHRIFAVLYYGLPLKEMGRTEQYRYCLAKNSLDLMTVMLVVHGQLASGFINRLEQIRRLPVDEKIKAYFEYCLSVKLGTEHPETYATEEMEDLFISIVRELDKQFRVPLVNMVRNGRHVIRRMLGMCKRAIQYRHLPRRGHLKQLIARFERKEHLTKMDLMDNLVRNGYPTMEKHHEDCE